MMIVEEKIQCYAIALNTSIGVRYGSMTAKWSSDRIYGQIDILNHREDFEGVAGDDGRCRIRGRIVSLTKALPYEAEGMMSESEVHLWVQTEKDRYELTGVPLKKEGEL